MVKVNRGQCLLWLLAIIVIIPGLILVGCGSSDSEPTPSQSVTIPSPSPVAENPPVMLDDNSSEIFVPTPELTPETDTIENSGTAQTEIPFPHLEIQGVTAEPIPWFETSQMGGCDYFRIKLTFEIVNIGKANFPPPENAPCYWGGRLHWRILYNGERDESGYTNIYDIYRMRDENLDIPAAGTAIVEREFRAAIELPRNPFQVVAWFSAKTSGDAREDPIPATDASAIQYANISTIVLQLEGAPFVSEPFEIPGPDIKPVAAFYIPKEEHSNYYDVGLIFENVGVETAGSVYVSLSVPDKTGAYYERSINVYGDIPGPFRKGKHAAIFCNTLASGVPDFPNVVFKTTLNCSELSSLGDVDGTNDTKEFETALEQPSSDIYDLLVDCISTHFAREGCD